MPLRITTLNVNSIRIRLDLLARVVEEVRPDVLCLQEIKIETERFPGEAMRALGFPYQHVYGQKAYHGVAILSKLPFRSVGTRTWCGSDHARHCFVTLENELEVHDFYVPAGGDIPDPETNPKFAHKLQMLNEMAVWLEGMERRDHRMVVVGDLNIAPLEQDVWSHKQLLGVVSHTPVEVEALKRVQAGYDFTDALRQIVPPSEKLYSWWSYRNRDWEVSDRGRRLDHVWLAPAIRDRLAGGSILRSARGWDQPSDHVPVSVDLDI
ncbi:exodeoxyribonuclease III [Geminicoccus roseus]|uniref:exodeoxyribonuclease III n=1 Tax=Geminicoccus roseus TaxID=404900 RepID=UPI0004177BB3|nr:exodeoxyribonuclease III [Geminicoccus roseus]